MNEIERLLEETPLAQPRDRLDTRMDRLFSEPPRPRRILTRPVALWQTAAACAACAALGFFVHESFSGARDLQLELPTVVYVIEAGTHVPLDAFTATHKRDEFRWDPGKLEVQVTVSDEHYESETGDVI